jgi:hypothetical protein
MSRPLRLALVIAGLAPCLGTQRSISDSALQYPYVGFADDTTVIHWNRGSIAFAVAGATAVRINSRGVQYIYPEHGAIDTSTWFQGTCVTTPDTLCLLQVGHTTCKVLRTVNL